MATVFGANEELQTKRTVVLVITDHPLDFPDHFCIRAQIPYMGEILYGRFAGLYDSLDEAREDIPVTAVRLPRSAGDDSVIVESWVL